MEAGGVGENELNLVLGQHAHYFRARGLRLWRHDGDLLAEQAVEYRRLADIRAADYCDESGSCLSHNFSSYR